MQRRRFLWGGGSLTAALALSPALAIGGSVAEITMLGRPNGSKVWFDPYGLLVRAGDTIRWTNRDPANSHTATAYATENEEHPRRIPEGAAAFDSDYLLPDTHFEVTLTVPGIYDYFCAPHEMSGMVGRIIVADVGQTRFDDYPPGDLEQDVLDGFPSIAAILAKGSVRMES